MDELNNALREALADTFVMYFKAHSFHWNVEGPDFQQYHSFLNDLYEELHDAVDTIAEHIRAIDYYAPTSLTTFLDNTKINEKAEIKSAVDMLKELSSDNNVVLASLYVAYQLAEDNTELGLANFIQDRIDIHQKHGWMLKAITK